jgi:D-glycero-alpha-D-manno-heptose-7-phosphate kinase
VQVNEQGSVRVDLLGGTLDLVPINVVIRNTVTLNLATSLKAKVQLESIDEDIVEIISKDYDSKNTFLSKDFTNENYDGDHFGPLSFVCQILGHFGLTNRVRITLESGSPPGAGLGGSSSMGVTLYKALAKYTDTKFDRLEAVKTVSSIEAKILNKGPCGYQDYYPALYGGILGLVPTATGIDVEQLFCPEFKEFIEKRVTLIYSGNLRLSAINNWEVYKDFFDNRNGVREGLMAIADLANEALECLRNKKFERFLELLSEEGSTREKLFSNIVTDDMREVYKELGETASGMKICGAGGGGCFIITHKEGDHDKIKEVAEMRGMQVLEFQVCEPLN